LGLVKGETITWLVAHSHSPWSDILAEMSPDLKQKVLLKVKALDGLDDYW
jgi:hypothetical protein